jgi:UDP-GlcNAc:undecaprenyl-phosphate GlcNAc-1-phosphate transferase
MIKELLENFNPQDYIVALVLVGFCISFVVAWASYPAIIKVAKEKHLLDTPDDRSSHSVTVPNLGGVGIYIGIVVAITIIGAILDTRSLLLILGGMTILFFLGLKDDILILSPRKKFIGQLVAALLLIVFTDTRIQGFSGLFEITLMPYTVSVLFTLFVYILIINAYNLIDGVDGLAGSLTLVACVTFGIAFYRYEDVSMMVLAAAAVGALVPFLCFNFSRRRKMFMGDTGSMILGFIIAVLAIRFIDVSESGATRLYHTSSPVLVLAFLFFPLLDTLRIFFIRLVIHKTSPFAADKNHLHHRFLSFGFTHGETTAIIAGINCVIIGIAFAIQNLDIHWQLGLLLASGTLLYSLYFLFHWIRELLQKKALEVKSE